MNFRVEAEVMARYLPDRFRPKLHAGYAVAGIYLIRLEEIRPRLWPAAVGLSSENTAHRTFFLNGGVQLVIGGISQLLSENLSDRLLRFRAVEIDRNGPANIIDRNHGGTLGRD